MLIFPTSPKIPTQFFMSYSTANEYRSFRTDFRHFKNLARFDPGVCKVNLFISVSEVFPRKRSDENLVCNLARIAEGNPKIKILSITFKSNIGRDFSSAGVNLQHIANIAYEKDFVLFTNRSAYGPLMHNWYTSYIEQYEKFNNVGLCGSTIRFTGHPERPCEGISTHVQSYVYLCRFLHLTNLINNFPGQKAKNRLDAIVDGEIALSRYILNRNLSLTCLAWPNHVFSLNKPSDPKLPQRDIKSIVRNVPFRYKYPSYLN